MHRTTLGYNPGRQGLVEETLKARRILLIGVLAALAFLNTLSGSFVYDDISEILMNPRAHRLSAIPSLLTTEFWQRERGHGVIYRPVTAATIPPLFLLDGGKPWPFHAANILLHALVSCLLAAVIARLTGDTLLATLFGILFALHPAHPEAVAWISGRSELLFATAGALSWWFHLRARQGGRPGCAAAAATLLAASLGAKETAFCWPVIFVAADLLFPEGGAQRRPPLRQTWHPPLLRLYGIYAMVSVAWLALRFEVLGQIGRKVQEAAHLLNPLESDPWWPARPFTFLRLLGVAAWKCTFPWPGCIDYGFNQIPLARGPFALDVVAAAAGLLAFAVWARRSWRRRERNPAAMTLLLAACIFLLSWLPASSLLVPSVSIFAERNLYLPSSGWCLAAAVLGAWAWRRARSGPAWVAAAALSAALAAGMGAMTMARNTAFAGAMTLYSSSAANCANSARIHLLRGGLLEEAGRLQEASEAYGRSIAIAPDYTVARANLSRMLARLGRGEEAAREASEALASHPESIEARIAVITALEEVGLTDESEKALEDLVKGHPDDPWVLFQRAQRLRRKGRLDDALAAYQEIRDRFPDSFMGYNGVAAVHMQHGDTDAAREAFLATLKMDPYDNTALYYLGLLALQARPADAQRALEAAGWMSRYVRLMPEAAEGWLRLGQARQRLGDRDGAESAYRRADHLAPRDPGIRQALETFLEGKTR
jgi:tetratricopeptide (TPR) repeat protein